MEDKNLPKIKMDNMTWAKTGTNKIDHYGVGPEVMEMRRKGYSYMKIAKELSTTYSDKMGGDTISMVTVKRWCGVHVDEPADPNGDKVVNAYRENVKMLNMIESNIELLTVFLDATQSMIAEGADNKTVLSLFHSTTDLQKQLERYIARKQDLVMTIFNLQKEIYNMHTMKEVLRVTLQTVRKADQNIYNQVLMELRKNEKFMEAIKKFDENPSNVPESVKNFKK